MLRPWFKPDCGSTRRRGRGRSSWPGLDTAWDTRDSACGSGIGAHPGVPVRPPARKRLGSTDIPWIEPYLGGGHRVDGIAKGRDGSAVMMAK